MTAIERYVIQDGRPKLSIIILLNVQRSFADGTHISYSKSGEGAKFADGKHISYSKSRGGANLCTRHAHGKYVIDVTGSYILCNEFMTIIIRDNINRYMCVLDYFRYSISFTNSQTIYQLIQIAQNQKIFWYSGLSKVHVIWIGSKDEFKLKKILLTYILVFTVEKGIY